MLPNVISESCISRFKYWDNTVKDGMFFQNKFYTPIDRFAPQKRLVAYDTGCEFSSQGIKVCITVAESGYVLWQELNPDLLNLSSAQTH
jgi:hypothetical protein